MFSLNRGLIALSIFNSVHAALYVTFPTQSDTCAVLQPCQIKWKDDSNTPSTSTMGETTIDLVMGSAANLQAVQNLGGVSNPSVATALTFQPIAGLSPTQKYAIRFVAKSNPSNPIFSTFFAITGGSGTATPIVTPNSASSSSSSTGSPASIIANKTPTALSSTAPNATASINSTSSAKPDKSLGSAVTPVPIAILSLVVGGLGFLNSFIL